MKTLLTLAVLIGLSSLALNGVAGAHGGTYRGPTDSTPPGGGSGSGSSGSGSSTGTTSTGGSNRGGASGTSGQGASGTNSPSTTPSGPGIPSGGGAATWEPWWAFNRDPFLNLKAVIHESRVRAGSDTWFLGHLPTTSTRDQLRPTDKVIQEEITPALLRVLAKERDNDLVTGVLVALAKIGDRQGVSADEVSKAQTIQTFLGSPNQEIAETAALSLGILANESSVDLLIALVNDSKDGRRMVGNRKVSWRTRAFAAYGLGLIGFYSEDADQRQEILTAVRTLLAGDALKMATPDVAVACLTAMGLVRLELEPQCLLVAGKCPSPSHCRRGQIQWLRELASREDLNYVLRSHIPITLGRLTLDTEGDPQLRATVVKDLLSWAGGSSKTQRHLRASSIMALGVLGTGSGQPVDSAIIEALMGTAKNSRLLEVRTLALIALGQVGARRGPGGELDEDGVVAIREFLIEQFVEGRSTDRGWSALALSLLENITINAGLPPSARVPGLIRKELGSATSPDQVGALAVALGIMQDTDSSSIMLEKLSKLSDDRSRGYLCIGLGLMNSRESIEPLSKLLKSSRYRPLLLREAAISLGLLGDKNVVEDLIVEMQGSTSLTAQSSIAAALGSIGDARSVRPLLKMLEDPELNVRARAFAAVALGIVADKEPLPWNSKIAVGANYLAGTPTLTDGQGTGVLDIL